MDLRAPEDEGKDFAKMDTCNCHRFIEINNDEITHEEMTQEYFAPEC